MRIYDFETFRNRTTETVLDKLTIQQQNELLEHLRETVKQRRISIRDKAEQALQEINQHLEI